MFIPIRGLKSPGRYPSTEDQARHIYRHRRQNGLAAAFVKVQGRVLFDPDKIEALLAARAGSSAAAG